MEERRDLMESAESEWGRLLLFLIVDSQTE